MPAFLRLLVGVDAEGLTPAEEVGESASLLADASSSGSDDKETTIGRGLASETIHCFRRKAMAATA